MKYTKTTSGRSQVRRRLWFGEDWDGGGFFQMTTWSGLYLAALRLIVGGEDRTVGLLVSLFWRTAIVSVYLPRLRRHVPYEARETGLHLVQNEDTSWWDMPLSIAFWRDDMGSSYGRWQRMLAELPWRGAGWHWYLHPFRWIVGDADVEYDASSERSEPVLVRMPEGDYPAVWTRQRCRWQRPRWFAAAWVWRHSLDIPGGIPLAGKGENGWDCDDDATYGVTMAATDLPETPAETAEKFADRHLADRIRRGGSGWVPNGGWPEHRQLRAAPFAEEVPETA